MQSRFESLRSRNVEQLKMLEETRKTMEAQGLRIRELGEELQSATVDLEGRGRHIQSLRSANESESYMVAMTVKIQSLQAQIQTPKTSIIQPQGLNTPNRKQWHGDFLEDEATTIRKDRIQVIVDVLPTTRSSSPCTKNSNITQIPFASHQYNPSHALFAVQNHLSSPLPLSY